LDRLHEPIEPIEVSFLVVVFEDIPAQEIPA
jgi:hypothetical protein